MYVILSFGSVFHTPGWRLRRVPFHWYLLIVPPAVFMAAAMNSNLNIGQRHILPVYPFLFVIVAVTLVRWHPRVILLPLAALLVLEHLTVAPHYLAFFNFVSGGSNNGHKYLLDSNLDWGQDLGKLKTYLDANKIDRVCLSYFGTARPEHHGIHGHHVPTTDHIEARNNIDCVVAISANYLHGIFGDPSGYQWLRELTPTERIGYSIYVYDLRKDRSRDDPG